MLVPMINEAVFILYEGLAQAEDIDAAMKLGAAHPMGPLTLADMIGLDVCLWVMDVLHQEFADSSFGHVLCLNRWLMPDILGANRSRLLRLQQIRHQALRSLLTCSQCCGC